MTRITTGNQESVTVQADEAQRVSDTIKDISSSIQGMHEQINGLMAQIAAIQAELQPRKDEKPEDYQARVQGVASRIQGLNDQIRNIYSRIGQAEGRLRYCQNTKFPQAVRNDASKVHEEFERQKKNLDSQAESINKSSAAGEQDDELAQVLKAVDAKFEFKTKEEPTLKQVIKGFQLALSHATVALPKPHDSPLINPKPWGRILPTGDV